MRPKNIAIIFMMSFREIQMSCEMHKLCKISPIFSNKIMNREGEQVTATLL